LEWNAINITDTNFTEHHRLYEEFGFCEIAAKLCKFRPSTDFKEAKNADRRERIAALEQKANQHSHGSAMMQNKVTQLFTDF
jgi:bacterioferritin (cytochrome b1)